jgi:hypothetical protein
MALSKVCVWQHEHEGPPYNVLAQHDTDSVALFVRLVMARSRAPVGQPVSTASHFVMKNRRGVKTASHAQMLYSEQGLVCTSPPHAIPDSDCITDALTHTMFTHNVQARWCFVQVQQIHGMSHGWAPYILPLRSVIFAPQFRAHLLANVQHSLLFGYGGAQHPQQQPPTFAAPSSLPLRSRQGHQHEPQDQGWPHIGASDERSPAQISSADNYYSELSLPVWDDPCTWQQQQQMDGHHHQEESIGSEYCSVPSHHNIVRRSSAITLAERWLFL